jgi:hypothetical protein
MTLPRVVVPHVVLAPAALARGAHGAVAGGGEAAAAGGATAGEAKLHLAPAAALAAPGAGGEQAGQVAVVCEALTGRHEPRRAPVLRRLSSAGSLASWEGDLLQE